MSCVARCTVLQLLVQSEKHKAQPTKPHCGVTRLRVVLLKAALAITVIAILVRHRLSSSSSCGCLFKWKHFGDKLLSFNLIWRTIAAICFCTFLQTLLPSEEGLHFVVNPSLFASFYLARSVDGNCILFHSLFVDPRMENPECTFVQMIVC